MTATSVSKILNVDISSVIKWAKERGIKSPDDGDALALTFAMPISIHNTQQFNSPIITIPGFGG